MVASSRVIGDIGCGSSTEGVPDSVAVSVVLNIVAPLSNREWNGSFRPLGESMFCRV